jgi:hypothetical protein
MRRRELLKGVAASAGLLAFPAILTREALADGEVYQRVWDADQAEHGLPAIGPRDRGDEATGFVRVDEEGGQDPEHRVIAEVRIPQAKRSTYDLVKAVFDNYRLDQTKREETTLAEAQETIALLEAITDTAPMAAARRHLGELQGKDFSRDQWQEIVFDIWFRQYDDGRNLDLSGFEHVLVGEQKEGTVSGHHFWYRYYLDDFGLLGGKDAIDFDGTRYPKPLIQAGHATPEVVTLGYRWRARDQDTAADRPLFKPTGGFWVGCSTEGLMALGTVRFFQRGYAEAVINRGRYEIELYRSPDRKSLRTYFPKLIGVV